MKIKNLDSKTVDCLSNMERGMREVRSSFTWLLEERVLIESNKVFDDRLLDHIYFILRLEHTFTTLKNQLEESLQERSEIKKGE